MTDSAQPAMFGTMDVNSVFENTDTPSNCLQHKRQGCIRFDYDTGAATTALPVELAEGLPLHNVVEFIVAKGQNIRNFGRAKFQTADEFGNKRKMEGHATDVHKPLASAGEIGKYTDAFKFDEFWCSHSKTQPSCRRPTTRVPSIVSASWLLWISTSASRRKIVQ